MKTVTNISFNQPPNLGRKLCRPKIRQPLIVNEEALRSAGMVVSSMVCLSLRHRFNSNSKHKFMNCRLVIKKYSVNLYFSIIDVKLVLVEVDSTSVWR